MPGCIASIQMGSGATMPELFPFVLTIILVHFLFALLRGGNRSALHVCKVKDDRSPKYPTIAVYRMKMIVHFPYLCIYIACCINTT